MISKLKVRLRFVHNNSMYYLVNTICYCICLLYVYKNVINMTPKELYELANSGSKLTHEQELIIASSAYYSYYYALAVKHGRFELGETAIASNAGYSYSYANIVLKKTRFELGEVSIAANANYSYSYAKFVLCNRFIPGENILFSNIDYLFRYVTDVPNIPFNIVEVVLKSKYKDDYINWYFRRS
jgi:hypothetical protein